MPREISPSPSAEPNPTIPNVIAVVVSEYNENITGKLVQSGHPNVNRQRHQRRGYSRYSSSWGLGIDLRDSACDPTASCRGVIALGAVIKGETTHDQHLNRAVSLGLMQLSLDHNKPIALGLLTVNSLEQAIQRSGGNAGNKGEEAANALLACLKLAKANRSPPSSRLQPNRYPPSLQ